MITGLTITTAITVLGVFSFGTLIRASCPDISAHEPNDANAPPLLAQIMRQFPVEPVVGDRILQRDPESPTTTSSLASEELQCGAITPDHVHTHEEIHLANSVKDQVFSSGEKRVLKECPLYSRCDRAVVRDTYTEPVNLTFSVEFIVFDDGSGFYRDAEVHLPGAVDTMKKDFSPTGIDLAPFATTARLSSRGRDLEKFYVGALGCDVDSRRQPCYSALQLLSAVLAGRPRKHGTIYVLTGVFQDVTIGGFAFFPWQKDYHGVVAVNSDLVREGFSTVTHEIGHYFGLWHTFHGISEISGCDDPCHEKRASNTRGDRCNDTSPEPTNYHCGDPPFDTSTMDKCDPFRSEWKDTPWDNFMSYTTVQTCRSIFTQQQIWRMRCYATGIINGNLDESIYGEEISGAQACSSSHGLLAKVVTIISLLMAIMSCL